MFTKAKKLLLVFSLIVFFLSILAGGFAIMIVPPSVQLHLAGLFGCEVHDKEDAQLRKSGIKYNLLARFYRTKHLYFGGPLEYSDFVNESSNPIHALIIASGFYRNTDCQKTILPLMNKYLEIGTDVNFYDETVGLTPLHVAILWEKPEFIPILLKHGADKQLTIKIVNGKEREVSGMNANEFAQFVLSKSESKNLREIVSHLNE